eukprot:m.345133 g.345133  ORF g.345133 m.345133 type:complete len:62 (-) comp27892_c0_seq5:2440-2625(-)
MLRAAVALFIVAWLVSAAAISSGPHQATTRCVCTLSTVVTRCVCRFRLHTQVRARRVVHDV